MQFIDIKILNDGLPTLESSSVGHVFMRPMLDSAQDWGRKMRTISNGIDDVAFLELGVHRILRNNESGRDFFQAAKSSLGLEIESSAFFDLFKSPRRLGVLKDVASGLYRDGCRQMHVDALAGIPQLDGIDVLAGDGHLLSAACHAPRDPMGRKVPPKNLFMLNVRNGLTLPLSVVQGEGRYAHELPPLRRHLPEFLKKSREGRQDLANVIMLLDMAFNDTAFWSRMKYAKEAGAKLIIPQKSNLETIPLKEIEFDRDDPVNMGVVSVELVAFNHVDSSTMNRVIYRDPETGTEYCFLTTAMDLAPGLVALLYLLRWRIEKVFDVFKNKLHEKKAWGNGTACQEVQAQFACMTHNLIVMLVAGLKVSYGIEPIKLYKKQEKAMERREQDAAKNNRSVNPLVKLIRIPSQVSCQFIRAIRHGIDLRRRLHEHIPHFRAAMESYL